MSLRHALTAATAACALSLAGCAGFEIEPPADFLDLDEPEWSGYAERATSADGVVLAVREVADEREGTLAFWSEAIAARLRDDRGYALLEERDVEAESGQAGVQLRFGHDEGDEPYLYWVTIFPVEGGLTAPPRLYLIEAGGRKAAFEAVQADVERAIAGFEVAG